MTQPIRFKLYLFLILLLSGCSHLLYPADRHEFISKSSIIPQPEDIFIPVNQNNNLDSSSQLHGWFFEAQSPKKKVIVIHFHGNGQNLSTHFLFFHWLKNYGYNYLIFDYRGYGASSDQSASQNKTVEDGLAVFKYVKEKFKDHKIIAIGQSLGSNVLVRTLQEMNAMNQTLPNLVILDSSFLSYKEAASSALSQKWFLYPIKPLAYIFISDEWSANKRTDASPNIPALFFHGTNDSIINFQLGKNNFDHWPGQKHFIIQEEGSHTSAFTQKYIKNSKEILLNCIDSVVLNLVPFETCHNTP